MRRKLVLWGSNEKDEKMLVALELLEKDNVVHIYTFPENIATEEFYKAMSEKWKDDAEVEFPEGFTKIERKLSVSDSLLPDEIRVERTDLINRAQAEWHFVVLSSKLYNLYKSELEELKDRVEKISQYDNAIWEELRGFWNKVQNQMNEKNMFREHGASLREKTNHLFDKLKELKKVLDQEFETTSKQYLENFTQQLKEIEEKIDKGLGLNPLFDDLKKLQEKIKDFRFTKDDRNALWQMIDDTFKKLKDRRGAAGSQNANNAGRLEARYNGLLAAIIKMQKSVDMDQKDLDFQQKRVADSDGQLESQLRQAKIRMIEERLHSKQEKLDDMHKTRQELEAKLEKEKKRTVKAQKQEKLEEAKEVVKQKIASEISENAKEMDKISDKLEKAAEEIAVRASKAKKAVEDIKDKAVHMAEDAVDTAKAVAEVAEDNIDVLKDKAEAIAEAAEEKLEKVKDTVEDMAEKAFEGLEGMIDRLSDKIEDVTEDIKNRDKKEEEQAPEKEEDKEDAKE
jgi:hypothetical protein